jgi:hypothetical protein
MSAEYTFLPWMRRGLANQLKDPAGVGASRGKLDVSVTVGSDAPGGAPPSPVVKPIELVGPGDITGINPQQIIRTEPRAGVSDFEPNYLALVDFYDEDFLWRYSPFPTDGVKHRLPPWIVLIALKDDEFERLKLPGRSSPVIQLTAKARKADVFPVLGEEFAWAHVHLNATIGTDTTPDLSRLKALLDQHPDAAYGRLMCPRKLDVNTGYTAFIVPALDVGRRAGLGETIAGNDDGSIRSWAGAAREFPVYYEWRFRTGVEGDFELLARALVPRDMDPRVGVRDLDVSRPGFGVASVANPPDGRVSLEGALLAPTSQRRGLAAESDFAPQVAATINAPADAMAAPAGPAIGASDPVVAPPIYGSWHAGVDRVELPAQDAGWVPAVNLDPRYRAAAGLGARVVRKNQDAYLRSAWEQIGDVLTVNAKIRRGQLTIKAASAMYSKTLAKLDVAYATALASPVFAKVMGSPTTLRALTRASRLPPAALSPAFRKLLRPRGRLARSMLPEGARQGAISTLVHGINDGSLTASPPQPKPDGATLDSVIAALRPPPWVAWLLRHAWWLAILVAILALLVWALAGWPVALVVAAVAGMALGAAYAAAVRRLPALVAADLLSPVQMTSEAVAGLPPRPAYVYQPPVDDPVITVPILGPPLAGADSNDAVDMRRALSDFHEAMSVRVPALPERAALDVAHVHATALSALEPHHAIATRFAPLLRVGKGDAVAYQNGRYTGFGVGSTTPARPRVFREVMDYPDIKGPMYFPLSKISDEYFVPNLALIPNNTISLMKTNQEFIESYFVGLNHEFARELLWNEYPTDMQGSYFRQFWDVSRVPRPANKDDPRDQDVKDKEWADSLKDIPRLHHWDRNTELGTHNQRDAQGDKSQVIVVIRGDLLKRYPNTIVYAQRATWGTEPDRKDRLVLTDETGEKYALNDNDPAFRFPLYHAFVAPDIYFIGFDLTLADARGDPALAETAEARTALRPEQLGWFFVLQEIVGEPRFGMDVNPPIKFEKPSSWNDLSWADVDLSGGQSIHVAKQLVGTASRTRNGSTWGANAADMANILYQEPVMVGIHGREMLKNLVSPA